LAVPSREQVVSIKQRIGELVREHDLTFPGACNLIFALYMNPTDEDIAAVAHSYSAEMVERRAAIQPEYYARHGLLWLVLAAIMGWEVHAPPSDPAPK
jgi:hypothetical protein